MCVLFDFSLGTTLQSFHPHPAPFLVSRFLSIDYANGHLHVSDCHERGGTSGRKLLHDFPVSERPVLMRVPVFVRTRAFFFVQYYYTQDYTHVCAREIVFIPARPSSWAGIIVVVLGAGRDFLRVHFRGKCRCASFARAAAAAPLTLYWKQVLLGITNRISPQAQRVIVSLVCARVCLYHKQTRHDTIIQPSLDSVATMGALVLIIPKRNMRDK